MNILLKTIVIIRAIIIIIIIVIITIYLKAINHTTKVTRHKRDNLLRIILHLINNIKIKFFNCLDKFIRKRSTVVLLFRNIFSTSYLNLS